MTEEAVMWAGASGKQYKYWVSDMDVSFKDQAGNYIFVKETSRSQWSAVYIGKALSLKKRLSGHEKLPCVKQYGGTHIHSHTNAGGEKVRKAEETDLLAKWDPPCNKR
jgi:hypothetical protein